MQPEKGVDSCFAWLFPFQFNHLFNSTGWEVRVALVNAPLPAPQTQVSREQAQKRRKRDQIMLAKVHSLPTIHLGMGSRSFIQISKRAGWKHVAREL